MTLEDIRSYTEVSKYESNRLQDSLKKMLKVLFALNPCLKEELKDLFE